MQTARAPVFAASVPTPAGPRVQVHAARLGARPPAAEAIAACAERLPSGRRLLLIGIDAAVGVAWRERQGTGAWQQLACDEVATAPSVDADLLVLAVPADPAAAAGLFPELARHASAGARLFVVASNAAHWSQLERALTGDLDDEHDAGPHAGGGWSPAVLFRRLLDQGWMPTMLEAVHDAPPSAAHAEAVAGLAQTLRIPPGTALRTLGQRELLLQAERRFDTQPRRAGAARFAVVVPVTRPRQLRLNVLQSPGLREVNAKIVTCEGAASPAAALAAALPHCGDADWVLLCHQDVYFPAGFGSQLGAVLEGVPAADRATALLGFAGIAINDSADGTRPAGFVIDRQQRFDHPDGARALSIDELAIVLGRESVHRIDPSLGWHLWATDLCLTAICTHQVFPRIVRLPVFHNSVNDYVLPEEFRASARRLRAKHAAFGPIPTLCGTIDDAFCGEAQAVAPVPAVPADDARVVDGVNLMLDDVDRVVARMLARGEDDAALAEIAVGVHRNYLRPELSRGALYLPQLDRHLETLAARHVQALPRGPRHGTLLIATELYELGGHSRVLADVASAVERPVVVLTDLFDRLARDPAEIDRLTQRLAPVPLVVLPPGTPLQKLDRMRQVLAAMRPATIGHFGHHQDPLPFAATHGLPGVRQVLLHHGDHNAGLGHTLPGMRHVDCSEAMQQLCSRRLGAPADLLPLFAEDLGTRHFPSVDRLWCSVVTSGHPAKFRRDGPLALQAIVRTALQTVQGRFFHIGPLDADWVDAIRAELRAHDLDPARFVPLGLVPSVWQTLLTLDDAAVYLGSAPTGGGRAAIEAQGCGYPTVFHDAHGGDAVLGNTSVYANPALGWATLDDLAAALRRAIADHAQNSRVARAAYETRFSRTVFETAVHDIFGR